jgi:hypothetical protein
VGGTVQLLEVFQTVENMHRKLGIGKKKKKGIQGCFVGCWDREAKGGRKQVFFGLAVLEKMEK